MLDKINVVNNELKTYIEDSVLNEYAKNEKGME